MIVCDTMIWYKLGNGSITLKDIVGKKLICTGLTITELFSSANWIDNSEAVIKAVDAVKKNASLLYYETPWDFALSILLNEYKPNNEKIIAEWLKLNNLNQWTITTTDHQKKKLWDMYNRNAIFFKEAIQDLNKQGEIVKQLNKGKKLLIRKADYTRRFRLAITNELIQYRQEVMRENRPFSISLNSLQWSKMDFFSKVSIEFHKDIDVGSSHKHQENDYADLLNMVYVGPNDTYWTEEKKWKEYATRKGLEGKFHVLK